MLFWTGFAAIEYFHLDTLIVQIFVRHCIQMATIRLRLLGGNKIWDGLRIHWVLNHFSKLSFHGTADHLILIKSKVAL